MKKTLFSTMLIVAISLNLFMLTSQWDESPIMKNFTQSIKQSDFRQYLILKTTISSLECLIIFGGYSLKNTTTQQKTIFNGLFKINLLTYQTKELAIGKAIKPSPRFDVCGTVVRDRLLVYGGYQEDGMLSDQLWEYSFLTNQWVKRGTSYNLLACQFMIMTTTYSNDTITLVGLLQSTRSMKFVQYLIFNQSFITNLTVQNYNSLQLATTLWDGSQATSYLRLQEYNDFVSTNFTANPNIHFPVKYFCLIPNNKNLYTLVTNNGLYIVNKTGSHYRLDYYFERNDEDIDDYFGCINTNDWYFFIYSLESTGEDDKEVKDLHIEYVHIPTWTGGNINRNKTSLYVDWIKPAQFYSLFVWNDSIFVVNQNLQTFYLSENCGDFLTLASNLQKCVFGIYSCQEGWTGTYCNITQCPGSLRLFDSNDLASIDIECSRNGKCTQKGCQCYDNWIGEICDIYQKKDCQGTLDSNFIQTNCECNDKTTGGNQCHVVFCYNDCSGHGKCLQTGICSCDEGYKGPDCSILEINFDHI